MKGLQVAAGIVSVFATASIGAGIGYALTKDKVPTASDPLAGPVMGSAEGAAVGLAASGLGGVVVAAASERYRTAGIAAAGTVATLLVIGTIRNIASPPTSVSTGGVFGALPPKAVAVVRRS